MNIEGQVAVITGAGSGIGQAVAVSLAKRGVKALGLVDRSESVRTVAEIINEENGGGKKIAEAFLGDTTEAIFYGVHAAIVHPGFTNTPMVRVLGEEYIKKNILPYTRLGRLIEPFEIADAICFLISNSEVSGRLWADAGWHPPF